MWAGMGVAALLGLMGGSAYLAASKPKLNVALERLTVAEVKEGMFQEFIPVNGRVMPLTTIYLDAMEGGRVAEKYVEDGALMRTGQAILQLSNTDLELMLANQETQVFNVLTQMQISKNSADQNSISRQNQEAEVDIALREAERVYAVNERLYRDKVISRQDFESSQNLYEYQQRRKKLTQAVMMADSASMRQQLAQMAETYAQMKKTLELMRRKVGDLVVRAPIDGQLTSLDAEIGESKNKGQRLGQIDVTTGFKVRADVDEYYLNRVFVGLVAEVDIAGERHELTVTKVYTQVADGRFEVDMRFEGSAPAGLRRGQSLQVRLALSDETSALLLPKGGFYQQTGGNWVFKLTQDGRSAYRAEVQLGRQNIGYYEVLQGLAPGDRVITSSYERYGKMEELAFE